MATLVPAGVKHVPTFTRHSVKFLAPGTYQLGHQTLMGVEGCITSVETVPADEDVSAVEFVVIAKVTDDKLQEWLDLLRVSCAKVQPSFEQEYDTYYHGSYVEHAFALRDTVIDSDYYWRYVWTVDLVNPDNDGNLYETEVWEAVEYGPSFLDVNTRTVAKRGYKTADEARAGHAEWVERYKGR